MDKSEKTILVVLIGVIGGCLIISLLCGGILFLANKFLPDVTETATPETAVETPTTIPPPAFAVDPERMKKAEDVLSLLQNTFIPVADLNQLAEKFQGKRNIPTHLTSAPIQFEIGDTLDFFVLNTDTNETRVAKATLQYETENIYFWVENGIEFSRRDLKTVMDRFSSQIYPTDQEFFGKEWIPGVDNDPHLYIFYGNGLGMQIAGFSSSLDVVLPETHKYSNAHEMFYVSAESQPLSDPYTLSVMAHELQHLIHGYHDANEELWLNEGFSELATLLNGYDAGGFDYLYSNNPDLQLNYWPGNPDESDAHYGASFLFVTYMLDRFGEAFTRAVVADPDNGFVSIDKVLVEKHVMDPLTGKQITSDSLFSDWAAANYLKDNTIGDGRFNYSNYQDGPKMGATQTLYSCTDAAITSEVHQYGVDYLALKCDGDYEISFSGQPVVDLLPLPLDDHGKFWWSNRGDSSDIGLTREFDFTGVAAPIEMSYETWFDIETDYDFLYLMASIDGGAWKIIHTPSCTMSNITGNSYGCAYNGQSGGWITESVDLSEYAGKKVTLSFDYVTDGAVTGDGFTLDNVKIPAMNYYADFEKDDGGWAPTGFALIENVVPQTFLVTMVNTSDPVNPVAHYTVKAGESLKIDVKMDSSTGDAVLIISGSNRYTRQTAQYSILVREK